MIIKEIYEFDYELFLAEQELYESMIDYGSVVTRESYGLFLLNEGVKETIMGYLTRVSGSITKVWNNLKDYIKKYRDERDGEFLKEIAPKINDANPKFTMTNFPTYDMNNINNIKVIPLNFEQMKDDLVNKETFINKYYPNIKLTDQNKNFKDAIRSFCITKREDTRCTKEILKTMYDFCNTDYTKLRDSIQGDIEKYNTSSDNIKNLVNQVTSSETPQNECVSIYESYLMEAETDSNSTKVQFKDDPDAKQDGQGDNNITKKITVYVQVTTDILSAKMKMIQDIYKLYMSTLRHYIPSKKSNGENKKSAENNTNDNNTQVKI